MLARPQRKRHLVLHPVVKFSHALEVYSQQALSPLVHSQTMARGEQIGMLYCNRLSVAGGKHAVFKNKIGKVQQHYT